MIKRTVTPHYPEGELFPAFINVRVEGEEGERTYMPMEQCDHLRDRIDVGTALLELLAKAQRPPTEAELREWSEGVRKLGLRGFGNGN